MANLTTIDLIPILQNKQCIKNENNKLFNKQISQKTHKTCKNDTIFFTQRAQFFGVKRFISFTKTEFIIHQNEPVFRLFKLICFFVKGILQHTEIGRENAHLF